jgi:hypothetical protein
MTAILKDDPPGFETLARPGSSASSVPPALSRLVLHCLEKNPNERFQTARDVAFALGGLSGSGPSSPREINPPVARPSRAWRLRLAVAASCLLVIALAWAGWRLTRPATAPLVIRFTQPPPDDMSIGQGAWGPPGAIAVSPDGTRIAFVGFSGGARGLWIRRIDETTATRIEGTKGARYPVWDPDGKQIYYRGPRSMLMAQSVDGSGSTFVVAGTPQTLFTMTGVDWNFLFDTHDGKQFAMIVEGERDPSPLTIVVNWTPPKR